MRLKLSRIQNGPQITDNLTDGLLGLDLSSFGLQGGQPGDSTFFNLYVSIEATAEEQELFDYIDNVSVYLRSAPNYGGNYTPNDDFQDILSLGDNGHGLAIKNPLTGNYDLRFNSSNYNSENNLLVLKKEMAIWQDRSDLSNITNITMYGFDPVAMGSGSSGYTVKTGTNKFSEQMVGLRIWNNTLSDSAIITDYVSPTEVIVSKVHGWATGNMIYIKRLLEPVDGVLAIKDENGIVLGNCFKLECCYSLPTEYQKTRIKQWNFEVISGNEGEE